MSEIATPTQEDGRRKSSRKQNIKVREVQVLEVEDEQLIDDEDDCDNFQSCDKLDWKTIHCRRRKVGGNIPLLEKLQNREKARLRSRLVRANWTPEQKLAHNKRSRENQRIKRRGENIMLRELRLAGMRNRRRLTAQKPDDAEVDDLTAFEARRQRSLLRRQQSRIQRLQQHLTPYDTEVKGKVKYRISGIVDAALLTREEKQIRKKAKKLAVGDEGAEADDVRTWTEYFCYEMKLKFQKQRDILVNEALEIELGSGVPSQKSPLQDPDWVVNLANVTSSFQQRWENSQLQSIDHHDVDAGSQSDNDENDEAMQAVRSAFEEVEIKIEAEDYEAWDGNVQETDKNQRNCDDDIADWIARVITGEEDSAEHCREGVDVSTMTGRGGEPLFSNSRSTHQRKYSRRAKAAAVKRFTNIISGTDSGSNVNDSAMLRRWKVLAIKRCQNERLELLRTTFLECRQIWVNSKPEDTEKRVQVDQERAALKENVIEKKKLRVEVVVQELIHKRDMFSKESEQTREKRIKQLFTRVASEINQLREKRKSKKIEEPIPSDTIKTKTGTYTPRSKQEKKKVIYRIKMWRREYEQHIDLIVATGLPVPPPKFNVEPKRRIKMMENWTGDQSSVTRFEDVIKYGPYVESVLYLYDLKVGRTRTEVISYRKLMWELLAKRRKPIISDSSTAPLSSVEYEWTLIPETMSLEDMETFKEFITKYGTPVLEHLTFKRYYGDDKAKEYGLTSHCTNPEKREANRIKTNAYIRKRYIKKKYGIELAPGEYFDKKTMSSVKKPLRVYEKKSKKIGGQPSGETKLKEKKSQKKKSALQKRLKDRKSKSLTCSRDKPDVSDVVEDSNSFCISTPSNANLLTTQNDEDQCDEDSEEGWIPMASYECNTNASIPTSGQLHHYLQEQQLLSNQIIEGYNLPLQHHHHNLRSVAASSSTQQQQAQQNAYQFINQVIPGQHQQCSYSQAEVQHQIQMPQFFTLVNPSMSNDNNLKTSATATYQQCLPNSQIIPLQKQQIFSYSNPNQPESQSASNSNSNIHNQQPNGWTEAGQAHPEFDGSSIPTSSIVPEDSNSCRESERISIASSEMETSSFLASPIANSPESSTCLKKSRKRSKSTGVRDIWGNKKRGRKYSSSAETSVVPENCDGESPFDRNPKETRDASMLSHISLLLPKCPTCGEVLENDGALERHLIAAHRDRKEPQLQHNSEQVGNPDPDASEIETKTNRKANCSMCSTVCESPHALIQHLGLFHFEVRVWRCPFGSGERIGSRTNKSSASKSSRASSYTTPCADISWTIRSLRKHIKRVHPQKDQFWHLRQYSVTHARWCCIHCGIYVRMEDHWLDHIKLFHPEKPIHLIPPSVDVDPQDGFRCKQCHSVFSAQSFLDTHVAGGHILPGIKPSKKGTTKSIVKPKENASYEFYKCEICTMSYTTLFSLRYHCFRSHKLFKYLQTIKYPQSIEVEVEQRKVERQITKSTPELVPPAETVPEIQTEVTLTDQDSDLLVTCPICKTTDHNLHLIHKTYDKLMRRYCAPCNRLFSRFNVLRQHNEAAHGQAPEAVMTYPPPCGTSFTLSVPDNPKDLLKCNCHWLFTKEEFHRYHLFAQKDPDARVCGICSSKFPNLKSYSRHAQDDHGLPKNKKKMSVAMKNQPVPLKKKRQLQEEDFEKLSCTTSLSLSSTSVEIFSCKVCLKNFKTQAFLRTHIERKHAEDAFTRVLCKQCNTTFVNKNTLDKHVKYNHSKDLVKYLCPVCNLAMSRMYHLMEHHRKFHADTAFNKLKVKSIPLEEVVQNGNQVSCKICSRTFASETGLKSHMTNKHFPTHFTTFCEICGVQINPKALREHILKEHPENDEPLPTISNKTKVRLSLPELVDLVHVIWEEGGIGKRKKSGRSKTGESDQSGTDVSSDEEDFDKFSEPSDEENTTHDPVKYSKRSTTAPKPFRHKPQPAGEIHPTRTRNISMRTKFKKVYYCNESSSSEEEGVVKKSSISKPPSLDSDSVQGSYVNNSLLDTKKLVVLLRRCDEDHKVTVDISD